MAVLSLSLLLVAGCGGGGGGGSGGRGGGKPLTVGAPLVLTAGTVPLEDVDPAADDWSGLVDTTRLGLAGVEHVFDLTTPPGEPFEFEILSRAADSSGSVRVSIAHAETAGNPPVGGPETIAEAGIVPSAPGASTRDEWLDARGDGFAHVTLRGEISEEQVLVVETDNEDGTETAIIRIRPGPESEITVDPSDPAADPNILEEKTLYSSNSHMFGLPTVAVSGDRTSVVVYEGDRLEPRNFTRYEMRLQHEGATGDVTGGGSEYVGEDFGNWRDHEIAALYNVLAVVRSGTDELTVSLSFDRGATFEQTKTIPSSRRWRETRLVQIAMALDYSTAVAYWRGNELVLVEGRPDRFDGTGSPTRFEFDEEVVLYQDAKDVTPALFSLAWSDGGDLAVGYAFTRFWRNSEGFTVHETENRCAVRPHGGEFVDTLVEEDVIVLKDPSVALFGNGAAMRVFYAYESREGVRMSVSDDAGRTWPAPVSIDDRNSHTPTVLVRDQGGAQRVDLLYMTHGAEGMEIHRRHWADYGVTAPVDSKLTTAEMVDSGGLPIDAPVPGADVGMMRPDRGFRTRQVAWFGYDAVVDGDDVVVVYDEETIDAWIFCWGAPFLEMAPPRPGGAQFLDDAGFVPAEPPPLAAGMTAPLPTPDPDHMHQLKLLRLD